MQARDLNQVSLELIGHFEGFKEKSYKCPAGVWTIGFGTTVYPSGEKVQEGDGPFTKEECLVFLNHDVKEHSKYVMTFSKREKIDFSDNQFGALVSFSYNCGPSAILNSSKSLNKALRNGDANKIRNAFMKYNKARSKWGILRPLAGLTRRRKAEADLFFRVR